MNICEKKFSSPVNYEYGSYCVNDASCKNVYFCNDGANCSNPLKFETKYCDCGCEFYLNELNKCGMISFIPIYSKLNLKLSLISMSSEKKVNCRKMSYEL